MSRARCSKIPHELIPYTPTAESFVYSTFLKSFRRHLIETVVDPSVYYQIMHQALESLLDDPINRCVLCTVEGDPDEFLGWALGSESQLHYIYVKQFARRQGKARALYESLGYANRPLVSFNSPAGRQWLAMVADGADTNRESVPH
jgi:GNAT superfamily N-acetyltransferase